MRESGSATNDEGRTGPAAPTRGSNTKVAASNVASAPDWGRRGLSSSSRVIAHAAVEAFLTDLDEAGGPSPPSEQQCRAVVDSYDLAIGACSAATRTAVLAMFRALEWLPAVVVRRPGRFSRLPLADRIAYLEALEASAVGPLAMMLVAVKVPLLLHAFEHGPALRMTGFDRPSLASSRQGCREDPS